MGIQNYFRGTTTPSVHTADAYAALVDEAVAFLRAGATWLRTPDRVTVFLVDLLDSANTIIDAIHNLPEYDLIAYDD